MVKLAADIAGKAIHVKLSKDSQLTFGDPGMRIDASVNRLEPTAPDTLIKYQVFDSLGRQIKSGEFRELKPTDLGFQPNLSSKFITAQARQNQQIVFLDSQITVLAVQTERLSFNSSMSGVDSLAPDVFVFSRNYYDDKNRRIRTMSDTFNSKFKAQTAMHLSDHQVGNIRSGEGREFLTILPKNSFQSFVIFLRDLIVFGAFVWLMYTLVKLFKNFSENDFLSEENRRHFMRAGWLLPVSQVGSYIAFRIIAPWRGVDKIIIKSDESFAVVAQYQLHADSSFTMIIIGLGLIVVSYIFKEALSLKQEAELTV